MSDYVTECLPWVNGTFDFCKSRNKSAQKREKEWGISILEKYKIKHTKNTGNWSNILTEELSRQVLTLIGVKNIHRPQKKEGFKPDWECSQFIYEIKCRNYCTTGTIGEKFFGCMYKYRNVPKIYGKKLIVIVCSYLEKELSSGPLQI